MNIKKWFTNVEFISLSIIVLCTSLLLSIFWHLLSYWYQTKGSLTEKLKKALKMNEFFLVYQPIVDSKTGKVAGVEALIRWNNSSNIGPDIFIPVAEQHGLINSITDFVLERALYDWQEYSAENLHMSINVPPSYLSCKKRNLTT